MKRLSAIEAGHVTHDYADLNKVQKWYAEVVDDIMNAAKHGQFMVNIPSCLTPRTAERTIVMKMLAEDGYQTDGYTLSWSRAYYREILNYET